MLYSPHIYNDINNIHCAFSVRKTPPQHIDLISPIKQTQIPHNVLTLNQIHSSTVFAIFDENNISIIDGINGDGLITNLDNIALKVKVADCAPVAIFDSDSTVISLIHAGWRGITGNIMEKTISIIHKFQPDAKELLAYIGPCIHRQNYSVGEEFIEIFPETVSCDNGKIYFDLPKEIKLRLGKNGISKIEMFSLSTYETEWLHSYRRDGDSAGRISFYLWKTK